MTNGSTHDSPDAEARQRERRTDGKAEHVRRCEPMMPYIEQVTREALDAGYIEPRTAGELNYVLSRALISYVNLHGLSYQTINDVIGALEGAKAEFQRRVVAPYEDAKIAENGDLPWPTP